MIFSWLLVSILAYFFFSLSYLGDKLILSGKPKPMVYTFYVGIISIFGLVLIPFTPLLWPTWQTVVWIIAEALVYTIGLYTMFVAVKKFEVLKVMTTIGATQPVFIFFIAWLIWGPQPVSSNSIIAFVLLLIGSVLISLEKSFHIFGDYLGLTIMSSFFFSLDYIFSKLIFLSEPFLTGFLYTRVAIFLLTLLFLIPAKNRRQIFSKENLTSQKTNLRFLWTHASGGIATLLQSFAISLAPIAFLPIVNSLRGIQYVFLFFITLFLSIYFPKILKEKISRTILIQKIISIILIVAGLALIVT